MGMTREEFSNLAKGLRSVYGEKIIGDQEAFNVWYDLLKDLDYQFASQALQRYMMSNHYPPTVADIREQYMKLTQPPQMSGMEAWSLVRKALSDSTYHAEERFAELPPLVQRAVGSAENMRSMAMTDNPNEDVERSNFLKVYESLCSREKEDAQLPKNLRRLTESVAAQIGGA